MKEYFCLGSYTEPILFGTGEVFQGKGEGISLCEFEDGKIRKISSLRMMNPSFVCLDESRRKIYAVNEGKEFQGQPGGGLTQVSYDGEGNMKEEAAFCAQGKDPCHLAVSPDGSFLATANFASGSVTVFSLDPEGNVTGLQKVCQHTGSSVHPVRQQGPHAHSILFSPDGKYMFVPDLGTDTVKAYELTGKENPAVAARPDRDVRAAPGSGPRYGEFSPDGKDFYLINEIACAVDHFRYDEGKMTFVSRTGTLPPGFAGENICSDLHLDSAGRYLYASNRGHDSITVFRISENGSLQILQTVPCGGKTPRNFALDPSGEYLLCGCQDSDGITVFRISAEGTLSQTNAFSFGSPVCIQFLKGQAL